MSDNPTRGAGESPNAAQLEFQRYKARMGAMAPMPGPMVLPWGAPGWAMPLSFAPMQPPPGMAWPDPGQVAQAGQAAGAVAGRLGETFRLGVDVLNAALASAVSAMGGFAAAAPGWGYGHHGHHGDCGCGGGCGCASCCCETSCCCDSCCSPNVCGCCC
jgi:hypothetical protein